LANRIRNCFKALRKKLSRSEWVVKLLNLPRRRVEEPERGMILIQIDGLAYTQMKKALQKNRLSFLRRCIQQGEFYLKPFYSGVPSTTPAMQGELFFGIKSSVPAFEFVDRKKGERFAMFYPKAANHMAEILERRGEPLLKGGTSYANIYAAGADEARYCAQTMDLESILKGISPFKTLLILLVHMGKVFRILTYAMIECGLALTDFVGGVVDREDVLKELKFIPTRVLICIILRELIRFRVKMDVTRGVRIIHANFVGYDEQAHRRSPDSAFAHWALKGIDGVIKDIYRTALRCDCRDYRMIVYSDHGQESVQAYEKRFGKPVKKAIREIVSNMDMNYRGGNSGITGNETHYGHHRAFGLFSSKKKYLQKQPEHIIRPDRIRITTMGPVGHIYLPLPVTGRQKEILAKKLVAEANIPLVFFINQNQVMAVNRGGVFNLLKQHQNVLGKDHPFRQWTAQDLHRTCRHPNAGDLVISGWTPDNIPLSFNVENGAHGGPGNEETRGFVLLPNRIELQETELRPLDLREIILNWFKGRENKQIIRKYKAASHSLKVMTYNIHSCLGMNGRVVPDNIARIIADLDPDVVALQEVDANRRRTQYTDQAKYLARELDMEYQYFSVMNQGAEKYGLAILGKHSLVKVKYGRFPAARPERPVEPRGAMWIRVQTPGCDVNIVNTHLGLQMRDRLLQIRTLFGEDWLSAILENDPLVVCGDFNASARSPVYRQICTRLTDVQKTGNCRGAPKPTFFSRYPVLRLDYIFVSKHFTPLRILVPGNPLTRMASDHLPVFTELMFNTPAGN